MVEGGITAMEGMTTAIGQATEIVGSCVELVTGNPLLMVLFSGAFIGLGFRIFKKAKGAARG